MEIPKPVVEVCVNVIVVLVVVVPCFDNETALSPEGEGCSFDDREGMGPTDDAI